MRRAGIAAIVALASALAGACSGTQADTGLEARMRVAGAQFFRGAMPTGGDGPTVASVDVATNAIVAGQIDKPIQGALAPGATAVAIALDGDVGYWVLPAGAPDVASPTFPSFRASASFARDLAPRDYALIVRAVDAAGRFGAPSQDTVLTATPFAVPQGELVFTLAWDAESDLDLHVVDPNGAEIYARNINSWQKPPPGTPSDPNAYQTGGILDFDSNAQCVIDGRRQEDVVWTAPPPSGHYVARVDAFSLCGTSGARWSLRAYRRGVVVGEAHGTSFDADTRAPHDRGGGVLALEIDLP